MNCDCVERINKKLKDAGHEYHLATTLLFDDKMNISARLALPTAWNDAQGKRGRKKQPPSMLCTLCPFCAKEAEAAATQIQEKQ